MGIPRDKYEKLEAVVEEVSTPYHYIEEFVIGQVREALGKYEEWNRQRGPREEAEKIGEILVGNRTRKKELRAIGLGEMSCTRDS